eukprot:TRINITY_DN38352_c0_g1_i1.p1 TRINITY_DN38352_c0_g1~~TRINITY_DN38352_c0_g1_i1.p1  ORF type:complete len:341 (-),score=48.41 TRINITY_DN38352_c0_g1_i1:329-1351(-)
MVPTDWGHASSQMPTMPVRNEGGRRGRPSEAAPLLFPGLPLQEGASQNLYFAPGDRRSPPPLKQQEPMYVAYREPALGGDDGSELCPVGSWRDDDLQDTPYMSLSDLRFPASVLDLSAGRGDRRAASEEEAALTSQEGARDSLVDPRQPQAPGRASTWDTAATNVAMISQDGHTMVYAPRERRQKVTAAGAVLSLAPVALVCGSEHHSSGSRTFSVSLSEGQLGRVGSVGFAFDTRPVRRRRLRDMRTVFYNSWGQIGIRTDGQLKMLREKFPPLRRGTILQLTVDLQNFVLKFTLLFKDEIIRSADVFLPEYVSDYQHLCCSGGFLSVVVSEDCTVHLW